MTRTPAKLQFDRRAWQVPSENRALEGSLEGQPTEAMRNEAMARARQKRAEWQPDAEAWQQLVQLQAFVGMRVRIQFFDPGTMYLLNEDEWPCPIVADCFGVVTMVEDGHLQPFLLLRDAVALRNEGCTGMSYLVKRGASLASLAPAADLFEIESLREVQ